MTDLAQFSGQDTESPRPDFSKAAPLDVRLTDLAVGLITSVLSLSVLAYGLNAGATFPIFILLHLATLAVPLCLLWWRARKNADLTVSMLLVIATAVTGPIGALGCAFMALLLWFRHPTPWRLQSWYDYISGVVEQGRVTRLYHELVSGRLPHDPAADVPRFNPILHDTSQEDQQRVLGVIGRRYHADFRPTLRRAMRHKNGFIRAQAAAVASRLSPEEKARLWSTSGPQDEAPTGHGISALDVEPPRP